MALNTSGTDVAFSTQLCKVITSSETDRPIRDAWRMKIKAAVGSERSGGEETSGPGTFDCGFYFIATVPHEHEQVWTGPNVQLVPSELMEGFWNKYARIESNNVLKTGEACSGLKSCRDKRVQTEIMKFVKIKHW